MRLLFIVTLTIWSFTVAFSESVKITGRVMDEDTKKPIQNVTVIILGTTTGTFSNYLGYFEIVVDRQKNSKIVVSHIAYETSIVDLPDQPVFKFFLKKYHRPLPVVNLNNYPVKIKATPTHDPPKNGGSFNHISEAKEGEWMQVEAHAAFPGGNEGFCDYLGNELTRKISDIATSRIEALFTIDKDGRASSIVLPDSTSVECRAIREVLLAMPRWTPGMQHGQSAEQHFIIAVSRPRPEHITSAPVADISNLHLTEFYDYILDNVMYIHYGNQVPPQGTVLVDFQIGSDGSLVSLSVTDSFNNVFSKEVIRVVSMMPATVGMSLITESGFQKFTIPIVFGMNRDYISDKYSRSNDTLILKHVEITLAGTIRKEHELLRSTPKDTHNKKQKRKR